MQAQHRVSPPAREARSWLATCCRCLVAMPWPWKSRSNPRERAAQDPEGQEATAEQEVVAGDAVRITSSSHWFPGTHKLPVVISFTVVAEVPHTEIHPCWSSNRREWGQRGADGLTWHLATHRHDFTFRGSVFGTFPRGRRLRPGIDMQVGVPYRVVCQIGRTSAMYSVGRLTPWSGEDVIPYAECELAQGDAAQTGSFGFVAYDRTKSCTVWDVHVESTSPLSSLPTMATLETGGECPICFEPLVSPDSLPAGDGCRSDHSEVVTRCKHSFCYGCLAAICERQGARCPVCRSPIELSELSVAVRADSLPVGGPSSSTKPPEDRTVVRTDGDQRPRLDSLGLPICVCGKPISRRDPLEGVADRFCPMSPDGCVAARQEILTRRCSRRTPPGSG
uniref:RING-type domain-containing protein n=1 Tax=Prymnesium polylepis TaxID=72548 RepID=A0A7S4K1L1_9EUKA